MRHTPDPWHANVPADPEHADGSTVRDAEGNIVATVHDPNAYGNARLLAMAPRMYAILGRIRACDTRSNGEEVSVVGDFALWMSLCNILVELEKGQSA